MKSKINQVRKDLRSLKNSSHAIARLIEMQGAHFVRIKALESLPKSEKNQRLVETELAIVEGLGLAEEIEKSEEIEKKYMEAISTLELTDRALVMDCFLKGQPYYKVAMCYGFSESGLRKRLDRLIKRIAETV